MAGAKITIEVEDEAVLAALNRLAGRVTDMAPAMGQIGEKLLISTRTRLESSGPAPSGNPWAPLSPVTIARKHINKDRILYYLGHLLGSIHYEADAQSVKVGTALKYAAAQQFGMAKGYAGHTKRGAPIPWGTIPPRPYLGLSETDKDNVLGILHRYLTP